MMHASLLLLSLAAGYGVTVLSKSQSRPLDALGRFVGGLILIVSFIGLLCTAVCGVRHMMGCMGGGSCTRCMMPPPPQQ